MPEWRVEIRAKPLKIRELNSLSRTHDLKDIQRKLLISSILNAWILYGNYSFIYYHERKTFFTSKSLLQSHSFPSKPSKLSNFPDMLSLLVTFVRSNSKMNERKTIIDLKMSLLSFLFPAHSHKFPSILQTTLRLKSRRHRTMEWCLLIGL